MQKSIALFTAPYPVIIPEFLDFHNVSHLIRQLGRQTYFSQHLISVVLFS